MFVWFRSRYRTEPGLWINPVGHAIPPTMSLRTRTLGSGTIEPCLPSPAKAPPSGPGWLHEIKHDGFRILARRDSAGVRLLTRNGNDFTARFPLAVEAVMRLPAHSFLLDGEAIVTNDRGLAVFDLIRHKRHSIMCGGGVLCRGRVSKTDTH